MCGILAVIRKTERPLDVAACRRALSGLSWRGPDLLASSTWNERVFLGQTILSLTGDITDPGGGKATAASGRYQIAFNGEIYNYKALAARWLPDRMHVSESSTDTEVLANLHDVLDPEKIPGELDGMYAYVALDERAQALYLARDVQGEKSLYVYEDVDIIVVSSEIPAILSLVPNAPLDVQVLRDGFRTRHFMTFERTAHTGIRQMKAGRVERLDLRALSWSIPADRSISDWIDPARLEANRQRSLDSLTDELDALLSECTREMIPSRRRFAAVVSGGVDSSLLSRYVVTHGNPDLLIAVEHVGKDRISADLSGFEKVLGRAIDVLRIDQAPYSAEIVRCQATCAAPLGSHSFVPQSLQSARVRSAGCRALFGGEGGDELFGGYDAYLDIPSAAGRYSTSPYMAHAEPELAFSGDDPKMIQEELSSAWARALEAYSFVTDEREQMALAMMYADAAYQLPSVGLRGADLMSMMWSVETRSVFIRKPVVEFALNLPLAARIDPAAENKNLRTKVVLKRAFLRHYPAELLVEKQGFAGFPNESAAYLGDRADYLACDVLGIDRGAIASTSLSRATLWKLANTEYFLRSQRGSLGRR
ncbi:MAG TPA: asparagine synthase-related protein [Gemmatimonadaceae bacterium]|nr:asparagine synthase-related protein [Gemmatimonadaceae bacterium]